MNQKSDEPTISSQIIIHGDVINSEIHGIEIVRPEKTYQTIGGKLLGKILIELIGLPSFLEIETRIDIAISRKRGRHKEFDQLWKLWHHILGFPETRYFDRYRQPESRGKPLIGDGFVVTLRNIHLTQFVNRSPGRAYLLPPQFGQYEKLYDDLFIVSGNIVDVEDLALRRLGLGDVRFGERKGLYLLNALQSPLYEAEWHKTINDLKPEELGLYGYDNSTYGFPVVVSANIFDGLTEILQEYGSVHIGSLTGILRRPLDFIDLAWSPGIPKLCLYVEDRKQLNVIGKPRSLNMCSAWTLAVDQSQKVEKYANWFFPVGTKRYLEFMTGAANIISSALSDRKLSPVFEFDEYTNWFSESSPMGPKEISQIYKGISNKSDINIGLWINEQIEITRAKYEPSLAFLHEHNTFEMVYELLTRAKCQSLLGHYEDALNYCENAITMLPDFYWSWTVKSIILSKTNELELAFQCSQKALQLAFTWFGGGEPFISKSPELFIFLWHDYLCTKLGLPDPIRVKPQYSLKKLRNGEVCLNVSFEALEKFVLREVPSEFPLFEKHSSCFPLISRIRNALSEDVINSIIVDLDGNIYFGSKGGGIIVKSKQSWSRVSLPLSQSQRFDTWSMAMDSTGDIWAAVGTNGILRYDGESWQQISPNDITGREYNIFTKVFIDSCGRIWVVYSGLAFFDGINWTSFDERTGELKDDHIRAIFEDKEGVIWISWGDLNYYGISKYDGTKWQHFENIFDKESIGQDRRYYLISETEAGILVITTTQLLERQKDNWIWTSVHYPKSMIDLNKNLISLPPDKAWGGKWEGPIPMPISYFVGSDGSNYLATSCGFLVKRPNINKWTELFDYNSPVFSGGINCIYRDNGDIWIGTQKGIIVWKEGSDPSEIIALEPPNDPVITQIAKDNGGCFWIGTLRGYISAYDKGKWIDYGKYSSVHDVVERKGYVTFSIRGKLLEKDKDYQE